MDYEFAELERLVTVQINPAHLRLEQLTDVLFRQHVLTCYIEVERAKRKFTPTVLQLGDECRIKLYIHQHQATLIRLADIIYEYLKSQELQNIEHITHAGLIITFYEDMYREINGLLLYLEKNFGQYFDLDARLTQPCHEEFAREIESNLKNIQKELIRNAISSELIQITTNPFEHLQSATTPISYRRRGYLEVLLLEISNDIKRRKGLITDEELCDLLLSLNYNNVCFLNYLLLQYGNITMALKNKNEVILFYLLKTKLLNQLPAKPLKAYNSEVPPIRHQVCKWVAEELHFLEKKQGVEGENSFRRDESPHPGNKLHTSLGVAQLSFAIKLLVDSGIIIHSNFPELMKMVSQSFRTDQVENISEDSLRNKFYSVETVTAEKMKDIIFHLLDLARKY